MFSAQDLLEQRCFLVYRGNFDWEAVGRMARPARLAAMKVIGEWWKKDMEQDAKRQQALSGGSAGFARMRR